MMTPKPVAPKKTKRIGPTQRELDASRRCDYCGEHGHKANECPNK
jgi:hypothetical protein